MNRKSKEYREVLEKLISKNMNVKQMAEELSCSVPTVYKAMRLHGLKVNIETKQSHKWNNAGIDRLVMLLADPLVTYQQVGDLYGVSRQRIEQLVRSRKEGTRSRQGFYSKEEWRVHRLCRGKPERKAIRVEDFLPLPTHCPVLGIELNYLTQSTDGSGPSLDRVDSLKGYTKDNTVIMSRRANTIKNDGSADEHRKIAAFMDDLLL